MILQDLLCNEQLIINKSEWNQQIQYNEFRNLFKMISTNNQSITNHYKPNIIKLVVCN